MIKLGKPKGQNIQEIDFIVVNYTHQYILNIEAKKWLGIVKGKPGNTDKNSILKIKNQLLAEAGCHEEANECLICLKHSPSMLSKELLRQVSYTSMYSFRSTQNVTS